MPVDGDAEAAGQGGWGDTTVSERTALLSHLHQPQHLGEAEPLLAVEGSVGGGETAAQRRQRRKSLWMVFLTSFLLSVGGSVHTVTDTDTDTDTDTHLYVHSRRYTAGTDARVRGTRGQ